MVFSVGDDNSDRRTFPFVTSAANIFVFVVLLLRMMVDVPRYVAMGIWFLFQIVSGFLDQGGGGLAFSAETAAKGRYEATRVT